MPRAPSSLAASLVEAQADTERLTGEYQQARVDAEAELGQLIAEEEARRAAESAKPHDQHPRTGQALLARLAKTRRQKVAFVTNTLVCG